MNEFNAVSAEELTIVEGGLNPQPLPPRVAFSIRLFSVIRAYFV